MKPIDRFAAENEQPGEEHEEERNGDRDARAAPFAAGEPNEPGRAPDNKDEDSGPRKVQNERGDQDADTGRPKEPAFVSTPEVILHAAEHDQRRDAEQVAGLIAIGKGTEAALVVPEGKCVLREMQKDAEPGERDHAGGKNAGREPHIAEVEIERRDVINPGETGDQHEQAIEGQPGLRADGGPELHSEIVR